MSTLTLSHGTNPVLDRNDRRSLRLAARETLWSESSIPRLRHCGNSLSKHSGDGKTVAVKVKDGKAGFAGLQSCGSPWSCPVCSQKIAATRAVDVQDAVGRWHARGGRIAFVTLTMRHREGQRLDGLWGNLSHAWNKVVSGSGWVNNCKDFGTPLERVIKSGKDKGLAVVEPRIPYIRAVEVTHGANGWHVHIHALLFLNPLPGGPRKAVERLTQEIYGRWANALVSRGMTSPTPEHGIDVKIIGAGDSAALSDYFTKSVYVGQLKEKGAGWEVVGGAGKTARGVSRTPFQILADVVALGDAADLALWWEWEKASHNKRQLTWSVGLRDLLELDPELTDEEIAAQKLSGDVVMEFDLKQWRFLRFHQAEILFWVESGADLQQILARFIPL